MMLLFVMEPRSVALVISHNGWPTAGETDDIFERSINEKLGFPYLKIIKNNILIIIKNDYGTVLCSFHF